MIPKFITFDAIFCFGTKNCFLFHSVSKILTCFGAEMSQFIKQGWFHESRTGLHLLTSSTAALVWTVMIFVLVHWPTCQSKLQSQCWLFWLHVPWGPVTQLNVKDLVWSHLELWFAPTMWDRLLYTFISRLFATILNWSINSQK